MWWPASGFIDTNITLMVHLLDTRLDGWYVDSLNSMVLIMRRDSAPSSNQQLFGWFLALPRPTSGQFINLTWSMHSYMVLFNYPEYVCKLNKSFYGLKQAPRTRFLWFTSFLCKLGFVALNLTLLCLCSREETQRPICYCMFMILYWRPACSPCCNTSYLS
jgi:hypothetical protein